MNRNNLRYIPALVLSIFVGCKSQVNNSAPDDTIASLKTDLEILASQCDGDVGIALITSEGDTITVNNDRHYPLMSVFKLHQALAVARQLDINGTGLDSIISIDRNSLNHDTWSPMLKDYDDDMFDISIDRLLEYTLQQSDNNSSNLLFDRIVSVAETDSFIRAATATDSFRLQYTESEMQRNHALSKMNWSSPLSCAIVIDRTVRDSLVSDTKQARIQNILRECQTGPDRLKAGIGNNPDITIYHKTGSGYRDSTGRLIAHNDIGQIVLPDGSHYSLAVLVKDFNGTETETSAIIAEISKTVYDALSGKQ